MANMFFQRFFKISLYEFGIKGDILKDYSRWQRRPEMMSMESIEIIKDFMKINQALGVLMDFEGNAELWRALGLNRDDDTMSEAFATFNDFIDILEQRKDDLKAVDGLGLYFSEVGRGVVVDRGSYVEPMITLHNRGDVRLSYELARAISGATRNIGIARVIDDIYP